LIAYRRHIQMTGPNGAGWNVKTLRNSGAYHRGDGQPGKHSAGIIENALNHFHILQN
jgi:hypothetical protein